MKRDLFVTEFWEFDFEYHKQFAPQVLNFINSDELQNQIKEAESLNPSTATYGGVEFSVSSENAFIHTFLEKQVEKYLKKIEPFHDWEKGEWGGFYCWLNLNAKNKFNPPHLHPANHYSGVYYVSVPEGSGDIYFLDPRAAHRGSSPDPSHRLSNPYCIDNPYDTSVFRYKPSNGKLIIFPSWLQHYVDPNPTDNLRISIAFNASYYRLR